MLKNLDEDGNIALDEECETSGATSGEEIWGTPTSGGELEETHSFPNSDGGNLSVSGDWVFKNISSRKHTQLKCSLVYS